VESSSILQSFVDAGYSVVPFGSPADVVIVNTCTVTEQANTEGRQIIRHARRTSPNAMVAVTGCYAQLQPETVASFDGVGVVAGNSAKHRLLDLVLEAQAAEHPVIDVGSMDETLIFQPARYDADGRTRAFLKIQDGCDYVCTFCTIPRARGASRSMTFSDVKRQLLSFQRAGFSEIVITGVNIGEYRAETGERLWDVLAVAAEVAPRCRIRLGSVEPNTFRQELINVLRDSPTICRHVHIPLQSGSQSILRSMRRRYTPRQYAEVIHHITSAIPLVGVGIDVITGYPGEHHEQFQETYSFLETLPWSYLHVFTYSERAHTPAAILPGSVPISERKARTSRLRALSQQRRQQHAIAHLGTIANVLPETYDAEKGHWQGWSDTYQAVRFEAAATRPKHIARIRCMDVDNQAVINGMLLFGENE
jgi:threonylcarbamoyladenosine tRNA methylthiotransferase MtaB